MKSILVFRSAALGDFIMTTPALAEVRKSFPGHRLVLLATQSVDKSQSAKVARYTGATHRMPWLELAMPHLLDDVVPLMSANDLKYLLSLRHHLRTYQFEAAILMSDVGAPLIGRLKKLLLLRFLLGPIPVLGWRGPRDRAKLKRQGLLKHHVHGPLQFMAEMSPPRSYNDSDLVFDLRPGNDAVAWASKWLHENHISNRMRLVAIAPGSIQPHKRWPLENFENLLKSLLSRYTDLRFVVIGTPSDSSIGDVLTDIDPKRIHNLAGITSIAQSAALLRHVHLLVGNDGGAMHLGDAMGCKVVSIVPGIEFSNSIEPWHNRELAVRHPVECSPCYNFVFCPERHNRCMTELPVKKVLANCIFVLDKD